MTDAAGCVEGCPFCSQRSGMSFTVLSRKFSVICIVNQPLWLLSEEQIIEEARQRIRDSSSGTAAVGQEQDAGNLEKGGSNRHEEKWRYTLFIEPTISDERMDM